MSTLLDMQFEFTQKVAALIQEANRLDFRIKLGEALRSNEQAEIHALGPVGRRELVEYLREAGVWVPLADAIVDNVGSGIRRSQHRVGLAVDVMLFKESTSGAWHYCSMSEDYAPLGRWWKMQHARARWGGDFTKPDGGHFSFEWRGVA